MISVKQWNHVAGVREGRGWGKRQTKLKGSASLPICFFGLYAVTSLAFPCLFGLVSLMRYRSLRIFGAASQIITRTQNSIAETSA